MAGRLGALVLGGCGGGGGNESIDTGTTTGSTGSSGSTSGSSGSTSSNSTGSPWIWSRTGTSTVAAVPTIDDFVTVIASGSVKYAFHASASSSTTDPVTGVVADTSAVATLLHDSGLAVLTYANDSVVTTLAGGSTPLTDDSARVAQVLSMSSSGSVSGWQYDSSDNSTWADFANSDQFDELVHTWGGYTTPVGTYEAGKSWCDACDMAGNAYEWTSTLNVASNGVESGSAVNCIKGGSWYATAGSGRSSGRGEGRSPSGAYHSVGFRVAARPK